MVGRVKVLYYQYLKGIRITRPIIVIESDDWGSIRIPNKEVHLALSRAKIDVHSNPFNRFDTLESEEDLVQFFNLLDKIYHDTGKKVVNTVNFVMGNPDFENIYKGGYQNYYLQDFRDTYVEYGYNGTWEKLEDLISQGYFRPQFHAREHLQIEKWLRLLRQGHPELRAAFDHKAFCVDYKNNSGKLENLMPSYQPDDESDTEFIQNSIDDGLKRFFNVFGFYSTSTIAPVGIWNEYHEKCFKINGVTSLQSFLIQKQPDPIQLKNIYRYMGEINKLEQIYFPRNVYFEPSTDSNMDWVSTAYNQISRAFFFKKPAIISTHRINFVGGIEAYNREKGLQKLDVLLRRVIHKWPEVEFISSDQLVNHI